MSQARFYNLPGESRVEVVKLVSTIEHDAWSCLAILLDDGDDNLFAVRELYARMSRINREAHEAIKLFIGSTTNTEEK